MTIKHTLVSSDMRVFALCSLMELHRKEITGWGFCNRRGTERIETDAIYGNGI